MTKVIDMNNPESFSELKTVANTASDEKKFDIKSIGNPEDPNRFEITNTKTRKVYSINADALKGGDYHEIIHFSDDTISEKDIKKYYEHALKTNDDDNTPIDELWQQVNPGIELTDCYISSYNKGSGKIKQDSKVGDEYIVIVYLTPDWQPEYGGSIEFWTPNLTEEMKAMAINTPYGLNGDENINIVKSCWPKTGRVVVFDARIPYILRSVENEMLENVSIVFKGKSKVN
jgi:hypothetical protein